MKEKWGKQKKCLTCDKLTGVRYTLCVSCSNRKKKLGVRQKPETVKKRSEAMIGKNLKSNAGYRAIHIWVQSKLGKPNCCAHCKDETLKHRQYHWANISKKYNRDVKDWVRLCVKCHQLFDK